MRGEAEPRTRGEKRASGPAGLRRHDRGCSWGQRLGAGPIPWARDHASAFRPSPRVPARLRSGTAPRNRVIPELKEAFHCLSPRLQFCRVRKGFPGLPGDRAARRPDVRAR